MLLPASNSNRASAVIEILLLGSRGVSVAANALSGVKGAVMAAGWLQGGQAAKFETGRGTG